MLNDCDELPKISFRARVSAQESREKRRHRQRSRGRSDPSHSRRHEAGQGTGHSYHSSDKHPHKPASSNEDSSRVPPLPDLDDVLPLNINSDNTPIKATDHKSSQSRSHSSTKKHDSHKTGRPSYKHTNKKFRKQSVEDLQRKASNLLGDLFAVNRSESVTTITFGPSSNTKSRNPSEPSLLESAGARSRHSSNDSTHSRSAKPQEQSSNITNILSLSRSKSENNFESVELQKLPRHKLQRLTSSPIHRSPDTSAFDIINSLSPVIEKKTTPLPVLKECSVKLKDIKFFNVHNFAKRLKISLARGKCHHSHDILNKDEKCNCTDELKDPTDDVKGSLRRNCDSESISSDLVTLESVDEVDVIDVCLVDTRNNSDMPVIKMDVCENSNQAIPELSYGPVPVLKRNDSSFVSLPDITESAADIPYTLMDKNIFDLHATEIENCEQTYDSLPDLSFESGSVENKNESLFNSLSDNIKTTSDIRGAFPENKRKFTIIEEFDDTVLCKSGISDEISKFSKVPHAFVKYLTQLSNDIVFGEDSIKLSPSLSEKVLPSDIEDPDKTREFIPLLENNEFTEVKKRDTDKSIQTDLDFNENVSGIVMKATMKNIDLIDEKKDHNENVNIVCLESSEKSEINTLKSGMKNDGAIHENHVDSQELIVHKKSILSHEIDEVSQLKSCVKKKHYKDTEDEISESVVKERDMVDLTSDEIESARILEHWDDLYEVIDVETYCYDIEDDDSEVHEIHDSVIYVDSDFEFVETDSLPNLPKSGNPNVVNIDSIPLPHTTSDEIGLKTKELNVISKNVHSVADENVSENDTVEKVEDSSSDNQHNLIDNNDIENGSHEKIKNTLSENQHDLINNNENEKSHNVIDRNFNDKAENVRKINGENSLSENVNEKLVMVETENEIDEQVGDICQDEHVDGDDTNGIGDCVDNVMKVYSSQNSNYDDKSSNLSVLPIPANDIDLDNNAQTSQISNSSKLPSQIVLPSSHKPLSSALCFNQKSSLTNNCSNRKSRKRKISALKLKSNIDSSNHFKSGSIIPYLQSASFDSSTKCLDGNETIQQLCKYTKDYLTIHENVDSLQGLPAMYNNLIMEEDEDGLKIDKNTFRFLENVSQTYAIPSDITNTIIKSAFLQPCIEIEKLHWSYKLLKNFASKQPGNIDIDCEMVLDGLQSMLANYQDNTDVVAIQANILLKLTVFIVKNDLYSRDIGNALQIRKSMAYKLLTCRKKLIACVSLSLDLHRQNIYEDMPAVLNMLQELLAVCVDCSSSCVDSASNLAEDLRHIYINLPSFTARQALVQSVVSPLLCYKLVELVLESQYDDTQPICGLPESVADIVAAYFKATPLCQHMTMSNDCDTDNSMDYADELAMLLYFVVHSYLQVSTENSSIPLRRRGDSWSSCTDAVEDIDMTDYVAVLECHVTDMSPNLSPVSKHYIMLLSCLSHST